MKSISHSLPKTSHKSLSLKRMCQKEPKNIPERLVAIGRRIGLVPPAVAFVVIAWSTIIVGNARDFHATNCLCGSDDGGDSLPQLGVPDHLEQVAIALSNAPLDSH